MADDASNPCLSCGGCCAHFRVSFYFGELDRPDLVTPLTPWLVCMKGTEKGGGRCVALEGQPGQPGVRCSIYAQRPSPCRAFLAWDEQGQPNPDCQRIRAGLGLPGLEPLR